MRIISGHGNACNWIRPNTRRARRARARQAWSCVIRLTAYETATASARCLSQGVVLDGAEVAESEAPPAAAASVGDDRAPLGRYLLQSSRGPGWAAWAARSARRMPVPAR